MKNTSTKVVVYLTASKPTDEHKDFDIVSTELPAPLEKQLLDIANKHAGSNDGTRPASVWRNELARAFLSSIGGVVVQQANLQSDRNSPREYVRVVILSGDFKGRTLQNTDYIVPEDIRAQYEVGISLDPVSLH